MGSVSPRGVVGGGERNEGVDHREQKEKVVGQTQRNSMNHWKKSQEAEANGAGEKQKLGLCTGLVAKGPLSAGHGDVRPLSPGETLWWREAGSTPTKKTLIYICRHCS